VRIVEAEAELSRGHVPHRDSASDIPADGLVEERVVDDLSDGEGPKETEHLGLSWIEGLFQSRPSHC